MDGGGIKSGLLLISFHTLCTKLQKGEGERKMGWWWQKNIKEDFKNEIK